MEFSDMSGELESKECLNEVDDHLPSSYTGSFTRGSRYGQRQDELLQSMSSRYQTEYQNRRSREDQDVQADPDDCFRVDICNFHNIENAEKHNSNMYEIVQCEPSKPVYRRGMVFKMTIKFKNQGFDPRTDSVKLIFNFGPNPSVPKETKIILPLGNDRHDSEVELLNYWEAFITRCDRGSMEVEVYIPPDTPVGVWRCWVETCRKRLSLREKSNRPQKIREEKSKIKVQIREDSNEKAKHNDQAQIENNEDSEENRNNDQRECDQKEENTESTETNEEDKTRQHSKDTNEFVQQENEDSIREDQDSHRKGEARDEKGQPNKKKPPTRESRSYNMDYSSHPRMSSQHKRDTTESEERVRRKDSSPSKSRSRHQKDGETESYNRKEASKDDKTRACKQNEEEEKEGSRSRIIPPYDPSTERMRGRPQRTTSPNRETERECREGSIRSGMQRQGKLPYRPHRGTSRQDVNQYEDGEDGTQDHHEDSPHDRSQERAPWYAQDRNRSCDDYKRSSEGHVYRSRSEYQRPNRNHDDEARSKYHSQTPDCYDDRRDSRSQREYQRHNAGYEENYRSNDRSQTPEYDDRRSSRRGQSGYNSRNKSYDEDYRSNERSQTPDYCDDYNRNNSMGRSFDRSLRRYNRRGDSHSADVGYRKSWGGFDSNDPYRQRDPWQNRRDLDDRSGDYNDRRNRREESYPRRHFSMGRDRYGESRNRYDPSGRRQRHEEESPQRRHYSHDNYYNRNDKRNRDSPDRRNRNSPDRRNNGYRSTDRQARSIGRFQNEDNCSFNEDCRNEPNEQRGYRKPGRGGPSQSEERRYDDRDDYRRSYSQHNGYGKSRSGHNMERANRDRSRRDDDCKTYRSYNNPNSPQTNAYYNERSRSYSPTRNQNETYGQNGYSRGKRYSERSYSRNHRSSSPDRMDRKQSNRRHSFDDGRRRNRSASNKNQSYGEQTQDYTDKRNSRHPEEGHRLWWHREGRGAERRGEKPEQRTNRQFKARQEEESENQVYEETKELFKCNDDIYILFNPWCRDDPVFMENEKWRREYVLNDTGKIWVGTYNNPTGRRWVYGQFDYAVLPAVMYLLEEARMSGNDRANPVRVCRAISEMVNNRDSSNNNNGRKANGYQNNCVMDGRWDGNYDEGVSPYSWTGSPAILEQYLQTGKPVKYGQCWVFSALTTTICRALGIPCRSVTNFVSAHDTNNSLCIDKYFSCTGDEIEGGPDGDTWDSLWSFHSWNDVWMERSDLPLSYGGWQAIDATFQEENDGLYKCGPASLEAIRRGEIGFSFDTPFIFTEINSEIHHWQEDGRSDWGFSRVKPDKYRVGRCMLTKHPERDDDEGDRDVQDVLQEYMPIDGRSNDTERVMSQIRGMDRADQIKSDRNNRRNDVDIELEDIRNVPMGETLTLRMKVTNRSREPRSVDVMMSCNSVYYTGVVKKRIKQEKTTIMLQPKADEIFTMQVKAEDYNDKLVDYRLMKVYAAAHVRETRQVWSDEDDFCFNKPMIDIKVEEIRRVGEYMEVNFEFVNPLNVSLTNCRLAYECPFVQRATFTKFRNVGPNERITFTELFLPREEGSTKIVATFSSHQLNELNGATNIFIKK